MLSKWLDLSGTSNRYKQMYIKGFLDISGGNLIVRNNNFYVLAGDSSLNGNLSVGGTTTMNNLVVNNLTYNDTITFLPNSIAPSAIIGGVPGLNGLFNNGFSVVGDVSINNRLFVKSAIYEGGQSLASKYASINSPTFTGQIYGADLSGTPYAITAPAGTNTRQIATTAFVNTAITSGVNGVISNAPANLNTLYKLAGAINNDPSFANTLTSSVNSTISSKASIDSPNFLSYLTVPKLFATADASFNARLYVASDVSFNGNLRVNKTFSTNGNFIVNGNTATIAGDSVLNRRLYVASDTSFNSNMDLSGSLYAHQNINIYGVINQQTLNLEGGAYTNYNNTDISYLKQVVATNTGTNTIVGSNSTNKPTLSGTNVSLFGYNALPSSNSASNEITLGNQSVTTLRCAVNAITSVSDGRFKSNVENLSYGMDFINKIRPVEFTWNDPKMEFRHGKSDIGFIAQELAEAQTDMSLNVPNLVNTQNPERYEAAYSMLLPVMVKALQEANQLIMDLSGRIQNMQMEINSLRTASP